MDSDKMSKKIGNEMEIEVAFVMFEKNVQVVITP